MAALNLISLRVWTADDEDETASARPQKKKAKRKRSEEADGDDSDEDDGVVEELNNDALAGVASPKSAPLFLSFSLCVSHFQNE